MPLSNHMKTQEKSMAPAPPAVSGRAFLHRQSEMTTFDDLFGAAFGKFKAKSIGYVNMAAGNDDPMTTR